MKLFTWTRFLIVAKDDKDAKKVLRERGYETSEIKRWPIRAAQKPIKLSIDNGETSFTCSPNEAAARCGRGIIPDC